MRDGMALVGVLVGFALGYFARSAAPVSPQRLPPQWDMTMRGSHVTTPIDEQRDGWSQFVIVTVDRDTVVAMECDDFERGGMARFSAYVRAGEKAHFSTGDLRKCELAAGDPLAMITVKREQR